MQQTNSRYFADLLEVFRLGLLINVLTTQPVIAWADQLIMQEDAPDYFLIELSLSDRNSPHDMIRLLNKYLSENKPEVSKRVILGVLLHQYRASQIPLAKVVNAIDWLAIHIEYTTEEYNLMAGLDDEYRLATEGVYGTITEVEKSVVRFLSIYQALQLDNRLSWQSLNKEVTIHLNEIHQ